MVKRVKVAKSGYITIPVEFRRKFGLKEGSLLHAEATENGILFKPFPKLEDKQAYTLNMARLKKSRRE